MGRKKNYNKISVKPLLLAITALRNINVNEDYVTDFPTDDLGKEINKDLNFLQLFNGLLCGKDIYEMLGVEDSIIRERVLERLAYLMGIDYQIIYYLWLKENK